MKLPHLERPILYIIVIALAGLILIQQSVNPEKNITQKLEDVFTQEETFTYQIDTFATELVIPWDIAFDQTGDMYATERPGNLTVFNTVGERIDSIKLEQVSSVGESGLTGLALDPDFTTNRQLYLYYSYRNSGNLLNRVSRFNYQKGSLSQEKIIVDALPGGSIHNGGRLRFGPDGMLYIPTGDAARPSTAQDKASLGGKILRINSDGTIPSDNPFGNSPVFTLGHRNPQGLAWHPLTEELIATEHGETAHDELNLIKSGQNYGWPEEQLCDSDDPVFTNPIICSGADTYAPSGIAAYGTKQWPLRYSFFFAGLRGQLLERFEFIEGKVASRETIIKGDYGRLRAVTVGPDGNIYVSTSNRDGRSKANDGDDKILKVTPVKK